MLFYHFKSQKKIAKLALKEKKYDTKAYVSPVFGQFAIGIPLKIIIKKNSLKKIYGDKLFNDEQY